MSGILVVVGVIMSAAIGAAAAAILPMLLLANCIGLRAAASNPLDIKLLAEGIIGFAPVATRALSAKRESPSAPNPAFCSANIAACDPKPVAAPSTPNAPAVPCAPREPAPAFIKLSPSPAPP